MSAKSSSCSLKEYAPFEAAQASKPDWKAPQPIVTTKTAAPRWNLGDGATDGGDSLQKKHIEIDPFAEGRSMRDNYTLLISGIVPRPISFVSTVSADGKTSNLAPFSYFQVVEHDPPVFVLGFSGRAARPKDTLRNLTETGECVINVVSEHLIEAVNAASIDAPYGASEWALAGLHPMPSSTVRPARVQESIFSIECKLLKVVGFDTSKLSVGPHGSLAIVEATRFWVREDAVDEKRSHIDLDVLRPLGQLGGMSYSRISETFELPRTSWRRAIDKVGPGLIKLVGDAEAGQVSCRER